MFYTLFELLGVSHIIEILNLNESNEFEHEVNKQLEKKIEPMEPTLETINLGDNENPRLIEIGSTLNEKRKKRSSRTPHRISRGVCMVL